MRRGGRNPAGQGRGVSGGEMPSTRSRRVSDSPPLKKVIVPGPVSTDLHREERKRKRESLACCRWKNMPRSQLATRESLRGEALKCPDRIIRAQDPYSPEWALRRGDSAVEDPNAALEFVRHSLPPADSWYSEDCDADGVVARVSLVGAAAVSAAKGVVGYVEKFESERAKWNDSRSSERSRWAGERSRLRAYIANLELELRKHTGGSVVDRMRKQQLEDEESPEQSIVLHSSGSESFDLAEEKRKAVEEALRVAEVKHAADKLKAVNEAFQLGNDGGFHRGCRTMYHSYRRSEAFDAEVRRAAASAEPIYVANLKRELREKRPDIDLEGLQFILPPEGVPEKLVEKERILLLKERRKVLDISSSDEDDDEGDIEGDDAPSFKDEAKGPLPAPAEAVIDEEWGRFKVALVKLADEIVTSSLNRLGTAGMEKGESSRQVAGRED